MEDTKVQLPTIEELDKLTIGELVLKFEGQYFVTLEGYGGENKLGDLPDYVMGRIYKELKQLPNSHSTHNTWDTCDLYEWDIHNCIALKVINHAKTRGCAKSFYLVNYETKLIPTYKVVKRINQ